MSEVDTSLPPVGTEVASEAIPEFQYKKPTQIEDIGYPDGTPDSEKIVLPFRPLALADLDGTMTPPGNRLIIEKFIIDTPFGNPTIRSKLLKRFEDWRELNEKGNVTAANYEQYLTDVGDLYAQMCRDMSRGEVVEKADRWFKKTGFKLVLPYAPDLFGEIDKQGIEGILVTGAPFEVAYVFAQRLKIRHFFAMVAEVDEHDQYTGEMQSNTGLNREKVRIRKRLSKAGHKIAFGIGDTSSDMPLVRGAIELNHRDDIKGQGVLINPRDKVENDVRQYYGEYVNEGKLHLIPPHMSVGAIIVKIRDVLTHVMEKEYNRNIIREVNERSRSGLPK